MASYQIVTDSSTDLPAALAKELGLVVLPLKFTLEGQTYEDFLEGGALTYHEFYDRLRAGAVSKTAQITLAEFEEAFEKILAAGQDLLYIGFSSGLSGTYHCAVLAAEELRGKFPERKIITVDSLCASMGEGLLVWHACRLRDGGMPLEELAAWLESHKLQLCHLFTVDDLHFLKRGGRVSPTTAFFGTMMNIKPVLRVDDEGHLVPLGKARGRKASLAALCDQMKALAVSPQEQTVFISHGDCEEDARYLAELVQSQLGVPRVTIGQIGPVIGSHSGPGTVALFFLGSHR